MYKIDPWGANTFEALALQPFSRLFDLDWNLTFSTFCKSNSAGDDSLEFILSWDRKMYPDFESYVEYDMLILWLTLRKN